ncbi:MAG: hypothetical protein ACPL0C_02300 [Candidatus Bathyarchaeales archaeon]
MLNDEEITSELRLTSKRAGKLYPVLLDKYGNVIDGAHRLTADKNWPKIKLHHIESEKDRLIARLISNVCRRKVSAKEKREILQRLGEIYLGEGVKRGTTLAYKISEETGMSYRWVMKYLPDNLKERPGVGGPHPFVFKKVDEGLSKGKGKVARRATLRFDILRAVPQEKVLKIVKYANTDFVQILLDGFFYDEIEKLAEGLGITSDHFVNNLLVWVVKKLKGTAIKSTVPIKRLQRAVP